MGQRTDERLHFGTYGISPKVWRTVCVTAGLAVLGLGTKLLADSVLDPTTKVVLGLGGLALLGTVLAWAGRMATITTREHVAVRGLWRTRRIPWADVQDIRVETNPGSFVKKNAPDEVVIVYDRTGRRTALPHLNQRNLAGHGHSLTAEVEAMRLAWTRLRGADWTPDARVTAEIAERDRYAMSSWMLGVVAMFCAIPVLIAVMVTGMVAGLGRGHGPVAEIVFSPFIMLLGQFVVYVTTVAISLLHRRLRRASTATG